MKAGTLLLVFALGCAGILGNAAQRGDALARQAEGAELVLAGACEAQQLAVLGQAKSDAEADALLAPIQARCSAAYDAYDRLSLTLLALSDALAREAAAEVPALLTRAIADELAFSAAVREVLS